MGKKTFLIGAAAGYVLGARAGRERYEQIATLAGKVKRNPKVQQAAGTIATRGNEMAHEAAAKAAEKAPDWVPGSHSAPDPVVPDPVVPVPVNGRQTTT